MARGERGKHSQHCDRTERGTKGCDQQQDRRASNTLLTAKTRKNWRLRRLTALEWEGRVSSRAPYLTLVIRRQPLVRLSLVVEHPGEATVRPVAPHGATRGSVIADIADVAGGVPAAVRAPDYLGLVRARHASRLISRASRTSVTGPLGAHYRRRGSSASPVIHWPRAAAESARPRSRIHRARP